MNWYLKVIRQYADFSGRARRKEYWMFVLFNLIFAILAFLLDVILAKVMETSFFGIFYGLYCLFVSIPGLAVAVRRLHDTGRSGWWILISLIPIIGGIWYFVLMVTEGDQGENQYGESPKQRTSEALA